jgi:hypothetical protein
MRSFNRWLLTAALVVTATAATAQSTTLKVDDIVGVWNMMYESGEGGTFTITKNDDGTARIVVQTTQGGQSEADDIAITGDTITFARTINVGGQAGSVNYSAKLVDGKLVGTGLVNLGGGAPGGAPGAAPAGGAPAGGAPGGAPAAAPTPFTATRAP